MDELKTDVLYFGDNLEILRKYIPDNSIDLVYLDPPFNSKKDYNILFKENGGVESEAQIKAFTDTWHWTQTTQDTYHEINTKAPHKVAKLIYALHDTIGNNDVMAYLVMMTIRLIELHRVLKPTGSLYLHCDPTASHYLKLVLDQIFGPANFRDEITWKRTSAHSDSQVFGKAHDIIFYYSKSNEFIHNKQYQPYDEGYIDSHYRYKDDKGRIYRTSDLTAKGLSGGGYAYEWHGIAGLWRCPIERMREWDSQGRIRYTKQGTAEYIRYLDEMPGMPAQDVWDDIPPINSQAKERLGYETQKPLALLERIIQASSNEGDIILDPFCGCGTAVVAAQKLNRRWIGIDITHLAINLMRNRLRDSFPGIKFEVIGEPVDLSGAKALAHQDRYQFQWWALGLIGARPLGEKKKGADKGIDGVITFKHDAKGTYKRVVVQVKSGHVGVNAVRELNTVVGNEAIGVLITLEPPTEPMEVEAVAAGYYHSPIYDKDYPKIQILTVDELLHGKAVDMPPQTQTSVTFAKAQKITQKEGVQPAMSRLKFNMGDIVIGNDKKASFRDRKGAVIGYEPRTHEYLVRFDDGRNEYVNPSWLNRGV
jgi:site-specific DNA-methyltransferase (adenine-specific)